MRIHTSDSKRALQLAGQRRHYEVLLRRGHPEIAADYAKKVGLSVDDEDDLIGVDDEDDLIGVVSAPPKIVKPAKVKAPEAAMVNGWPVETVGVVWATCPNPMLIVIKLPDGRTASMWRAGLGDSPMGVRVNAVLKKPNGDPIYGWVSNHEDQSDVPVALVDVAAGTPNFAPALSSGAPPVLIG